MSKQPCRWFVEPLNDFTNEAIAAELARLAQGGDENLSVQMDADDGNIHNVWEVPDHAFVAQLHRSQHGFKFRAFTVRGRGKLREWKFEKKRPRRSRHLRPQA